jgi:hypothetical protein
VGAAGHELLLAIASARERDRNQLGPGEAGAVTVWFRGLDALHTLSCGSSNNGLIVAFGRPH